MIRRKAISLIEVLVVIAILDEIRRNYDPQRISSAWEWGLCLPAWITCVGAAMRASSFSPAALKPLFKTKNPWNSCRTGPTRVGQRLTFTAPAGGKEKTGN